MWTGSDVPVRTFCVHSNYCCGTCFGSYAEEHSDQCQCDPGRDGVGDSAAWRLDWRDDLIRVGPNWCAAVRPVGHTHEDIDAAFSLMMTPSQHARAVAARASNPQEP